MSEVKQTFKCSGYSFINPTHILWTHYYWSVCKKYNLIKITHLKECLVLWCMS